MMYQLILNTTGRTLSISAQIEPLLGFTPEEWMADLQRQYRCRRASRVPLIPQITDAAVLDAIH